MVVTEIRSILANIEIETFSSHLIQRDSLGQTPEQGRDAICLVRPIKGL
jgi:hypothetical protein